MNGVTKDSTLKIILIDDIIIGETRDDRLVEVLLKTFKGAYVLGR